MSIVKEICSYKKYLMISMVVMVQVQKKSCPESPKPGSLGPYRCQLVY